MLLHLWFLFLLLPIEVFLPEHYPFQPPIYRFIKQVWHPNICSKSGTLCTGYKDTWSGGWSPSIELQKRFLHIQSLLVEPDLKYVRNEEAAAMCKSNKLAFDRKAKQWVLDPSHIEGHFTNMFGNISFQTRDATLLFDKYGRQISNPTLASALDG